VDIEAAGVAIMSGGRKRAIGDAIGGVLARAGWGTFLNLVFEKHPSILGVAVGAVVGAVGLVMLALGMRRTG
jgi:uncharacterized membrane protein